MPDCDAARAGSALPITGGVMLGVEAGPTLILLEPIPGAISVELIRFRELTSEVLARVQPDCVIAPLVAPEFDVIDLAHRLTALDYSGPLVAVTFPLPDQSVIEREVANACKQIALHVIELD